MSLEPRFTTTSVIGGCLLGIPLALIGVVFAAVAGGAVSGLVAYAPAAVAVFVAALLLAPAISGYYAVRGATASGRGLSLGILLGSSVVSSVAGWAFLSLLNAFATPEVTP